MLEEQSRQWLVQETEKRCRSSLVCFLPPALSHRGACLQVDCPHRTHPAVESRAHHFSCARNCTASFLSQRPLWFLSFYLNRQYFGKCFSCDEVMSCTELVICCFDFLSHNRISEAVGGWGTHLQALKKKKKNCFENNVAEVSPYMLRCCIIRRLLAYTTLSYAESIWVRSAGVGAASPVDLRGLRAHLCPPGKTCSFCFVYWKHRNCIFGRRVSKQSYKEFSFVLFFFSKKVQDWVHVYLPQIKGFEH